MPGTVQPTERHLRQSGTVPDIKEGWLTKNTPVYALCRYDVVIDSHIVVLEGGQDWYCTGIIMIIIY